MPGLDVSDILTYRTARYSDRKTGVVASLASGLFKF